MERAAKRVATAVAHPNIALTKYWGKVEAPGNYPAVPSLSLTLAGMSTRTSVAFDETLDTDIFTLNGDRVGGPGLARVTELLDKVRDCAEWPCRAYIDSTNDFPTAGGLASSSSGFAALALSAVRASGLQWPPSQISDLARRSSASSARSVFGGFVELEAGQALAGTNASLSARPVDVPSDFDIRILVCVTTEERKSTPSTDGMLRTAKRSPYYSAWLDRAPHVHAEMKLALREANFERVGELAEASAFAMHASAIAAGVVYWTGVTMNVIHSVRSLRAAGTAAFLTVDAGPHVKVLTEPKSLAEVKAFLSNIPGVRRIIETSKGEGAYLVEGP